MTSETNSYPARLEIDRADKLDRLSTFFRILWALPILVILTLLTSAGAGVSINEAANEASRDGGGIASGLFAATALMILFRKRYPRWWFNFVLELNRFTARVGAYLFLLTDRYPSTVEEQSVHLDIDYPDAEKDLNRWLPLIKWLLAIPHYVVLAILAFGMVVAVVLAWFAILLTGRYPRGLFDYITGVFRWSLRVQAYAFLLVTDKYPPFSLK